MTWVRWRRVSPSHDVDLAGGWGGGCRGGGGHREGGAHAHLVVAGEVADQDVVAGGEFEGEGAGLAGFEVGVAGLADVVGFVDLVGAGLDGGGGVAGVGDGELVVGGLVLSTIISCSIEPRFFTLNVIEPAGAELSKGASPIGPDGPESVNTTSTGAGPCTSTVCGAPPATATPPSPAPGAAIGAAQAAAVRARRATVASDAITRKRSRGLAHRFVGEGSTSYWRIESPCC